MRTKGESDSVNMILQILLILSHFYSHKHLKGVSSYTVVMFHETMELLLGVVIGILRFIFDEKITDG